MPDGVGIPVGNLTSQLFANIYLDALDQFIKHELGVEAYIRYMDDFVILSPDKEQLRNWLARIEQFLREELKLEFNPKTTILAAKNGIDFVGYKHRATHRKVRKDSIKRIKRTIKKCESGKITKEQQKRAAAGESIDKRPKEIDTREEFGNWEMDSVLGKRGKSKNTLLVLTERKTRNEIIFKLPDHTDEAVVAALDRLERKWGADMFKRVFKTITVDNGSEFADAEGLQRSIINEGEKRTKVYYCHPYSSWERGTNEVTNKMIRRKIPKGTNFDDRTEEEVESIENWINGYPRKIHGYHSAGELFEEEVKQLA